MTEGIQNQGCHRIFSVMCCKMYHYKIPFDNSDRMHDIIMNHGNKSYKQDYSANWN